LFLFPVFAFLPHIVLCSHAVLESLPGILRWSARRKISIVQNGVDTDRVDRVLAVADGHRRDATFTIVSVARLIERKNPSTLMAAFEMHRDSEERLVYVGDGDLRPYLVDQADELGVKEEVTFTGMLGREDVYRCLFASDVFVSASRGEGLPVAVLEAMACGRPVILSDIPPHREVAGDADFIPLLPPDDVGGFACEIRRIRDMSPQQRTALGDRCRKLVEERFSLRAMHRSYLNVYARAMRQTFPAGSDRHGFVEGAE
jgi:glycosyltransferase involved in cell wall biosynthesis